MKLNGLRPPVCPVLVCRVPRLDLSATRTKALAQSSRGKLKSASHIFQRCI